MLEALKTRNPVYRFLLAYFLWMGRQSSKMQWTFIIGTLFAQRILRVTAEKSPGLAVFIWPVLILFYGFIYLSWVAVPLFNLLLRLNRFGRLVLSREERRVSNWFALPCAGIIAGLALFCCGWFPGVILAGLCAIMSVCVSSVFDVSGTSRLVLALAGGALAVIGLAGWAAYAWGGAIGEKLAMGVLGLGMLLFMGFQFLAIVLVKRE